MTETNHISQKLFEDWSNKAQYETLTGDLAVLDIDHAYCVQNALQELFLERRGKVAGRKIALTSAAMQKMCGIDHPIAGAIFANDILLTNTKVPANRFCHLGLEFELSLELNKDVPPQVKLHDAVSVRSLIAAARPAFEIIDDKRADYSQLDVLTLIADNAWCGGIVLGPIIKDWEGMDLDDIPSRIHQEGRPVQKTNTGTADPLGSLAWVLNHFSDRGITLARGEHIITGSAVQTRFPTAGSKLSYDISGAIVEVEIL